MTADNPDIGSAAVRKRPGMYVGDPDSGDGVLHLVLELVANACDQTFVGKSSTVDLDVAADGTITVADDGPGMRVEGGDGLPPIDVLLTRYSNRPTVDGHRPHVHLGRGGLGLFVINALSERFELVTVRGGVEASYGSSTTAMVSVTCLPSTVMVTVATPSCTFGPKSMLTSFEHRPGRSQTYQRYAVSCPRKVSR